MRFEFQTVPTRIHLGHAAQQAVAQPIKPFEAGERSPELCRRARGPCSHRQLPACVIAARTVTTTPRALDDCKQHMYSCPMLSNATSTTTLCTQNLHTLCESHSQCTAKLFTASTHAPAPIPTHQRNARSNLGTHPATLPAPRMATTPRSKYGKRTGRDRCSQAFCEVRRLPGLRLALRRAHRPGV